MTELGLVEANVIWPKGTPAKGKDVSGAVYAEVAFLGPGSTEADRRKDVATVYAGSVPSDGSEVLGAAKGGDEATSAKDVTGCRIERQYENRDPNSNAPTLVSKSIGPPTLKYGTKPPSEFQDY